MRFANAAQSRFSNCVRFAGESDDAAIVIGVGFAVENSYAGNFTHGGDDGLYLRDVTPFGKVRHAFDYFSHCGRFALTPFQFESVSDYFASVLSETTLSRE